jgi:hypothetical protein
LFLGNRKGERWKRIISGIYLAFVFNTLQKNKGFSKISQIGTVKNQPKDKAREAVETLFPCLNTSKEDHRFQGPQAQNGTLHTTERGKRQTKTDVLHQLVYLLFWPIYLLS